MSTVGALLLGLVLAFPLTWALQGLYSFFGGAKLDPSAISATDMRLIIIIILLTLNLFRAGPRTARPPAPRQGK